MQSEGKALPQRRERTAIMRVTPILLCLLSLGCLLVFTLLSRASGNNLALLPVVGLVFVLAGGLVGLLSRYQPLDALVRGWHIEPQSGASHPTRSSSLNRLLVGAGVLLELAVIEINGSFFQIGLFKNVHYLVQAALLLGGIALIVVGLSRRDWCWPTMSRSDGVMLGGVVLLAFVLRLVMIDTSIRHFVDEINFMDAVVRLWDNPNVAILRPFSEVTAFTWLYPIAQQLSSSVLGTNLVGLRAVSAVFGTLTVAVVYFFAKMLFHDQKLALLAAFLLATFPPHLHFSRIALNNIADPFFGVMALAFLTRGLQSQRRSDYVVAGALLGMTQYFYEGGRLLFPGLAVLVGVVYGLTLAYKRRHWQGFIWMLLVALIVAAPVYTTLAANRAIMLPRLYNESIEPNWYFSLLTYADAGQGAWLKQRYLDPLLLYFAQPDSGWFYGGHEALILPVIAPFFLLGILCLFWRLRSHGSIVLLSWILLTALGNSFLRESASSPRYVVVFPALVLVTAIGLRYALNVLFGETLAKSRYALVSGGIIVGMAFGQVVYYFYDHLPVFEQQMTKPEEWEDALFRLTDLPEGTHAHFIMDAPVRDFNVSTFVRYWRLDVRVDVKAADAITDAYLQSLDPNAPHVFFVNEVQSEILTRLRDYFVLAPPELSPYDVPLANQLMRYRASPLQ